jgi:hypothetical protein
LFARAFATFGLALALALALAHIGSDKAVSSTWCPTILLGMACFTAVAALSNVAFAPFATAFCKGKAPMSMGTAPTAAAARLMSTI